MHCVIYSVESRPVGVSMMKTLSVPVVRSLDTVALRSTRKFALPGWRIGIHLCYFRSFWINISKNRIVLLWIRLEVKIRKSHKASTVASVLSSDSFLRRKWRLRYIDWLCLVSCHFLSSKITRYGKDYQQFSIDLSAQDNIIYLWSVGWMWTWEWDESCEISHRHWRSPYIGYLSV